MKKFFFMAAAALALASCSNEGELATDSTAALADGNVAVSFANPYLSTTRATVTDLGVLQTKGFGVYAYEQGTTAWDTYRSSNVYPNFFYNQQVKYEDSEWTYQPVKYFSNNKGAKHSFFVYAPYSATNNAIFSMANNAPVIRYSAKEDYDLLWAPAIIDQEKPGVNTKLNFQFQHALSKVTFDVAPFIDEVHGTIHTDGTVADGTTITVRSVKFIGKVPSQGLLNLGDGKWTIEATEEGAYEITEPKSFTATDASRKNLISNMMVIPAEDVKIKVVYDVTTVDNDNPKNNSTVTNTVESEEKFTLAQGTAYTFHLDLGLTSVKFTADVNAWGDESESNVDLPNNHGGLSQIAFTTADTDPSDPAVGQIYFNNSTSDTEKQNKFFIWNGTAWNIVPVTVLYSTDVKEGKVQTGSDASDDASWTVPVDNAYYVNGGKLYQWKD